MSYMRQGFGDYDRVDNWSWLYYPPPYTFADPRALIPPPEFYAPAASMGLGCAGGGCGCAGRCANANGLSDGSVDWVSLIKVPALIVGLYIAGSLASDYARGGRR